MKHSLTPEQVAEQRNYQARRVIVGQCPDCATPIVVLNDGESWPLLYCRCGWAGATTEVPTIRFDADNGVQARPADAERGEREAQRLGDARGTVTEPSGAGWLVNVLAHVNTTDVIRVEDPELAGRIAVEDMRSQLRRGRVKDEDVVLAEVIGIEPA